MCLPLAVKLMNWIVLSAILDCMIILKYLEEMQSYHSQCVHVIKSHYCHLCGSNISDHSLCQYVLYNKEHIDCIVQCYTTVWKETKTLCAKQSSTSFPLIQTGVLFQLALSSYQQKLSSHTKNCINLLPCVRLLLWSTFCEMTEPRKK